MKMNKFLMLGLAGLAFTACSNEEDAIGLDDGSAKTLVISISGINSSAGTKAGASDIKPGWEEDSQGMGATNVSSLTLFFTDGAGAVKYTYQANSTDQNAINFTALKGNGVKFVGLSGVSAVYAVANKNTDIDLTSDDKIDNIADLNTVLAKQGLSLTGKGQVVYAGGCTDITPMEPNNASDGLPVVDITTGNTGSTQEAYTYNASIKLVPIISRIQINSIKVHSSGSSETFPSATIGTVAANSLKLNWSNFKPTLLGVYLNNFSSKFNDLQGTAVDVLNNESYVDNMVNGTWLVGTSNTDMTADAAYVNYSSNAYAALKTWGQEDQGYCALDMGANNCIAFNVFVPFDVTTGMARTIANPTIHFQFAKEIGSGADAYKTEFVHATGNTPLNADETNVANSSTVNIQYTMPQGKDYLFANISKLFKESDTPGTASETELTLKPGKIYNMDVVIEPVNMTVDLKIPTEYNVVVKITVQDFDEENIYPGLD